MTTIKWPEEVDVVVASDCCQFRMAGRNETHCTLGWLRTMFVVPSHAYSEACKVAGKLVQGQGIVNWNDTRGRSLNQISTLINRVTATLGYTVRNPEAHNAGKPIT